MPEDRKQRCFGRVACRLFFENAADMQVALGQRAACNERIGRLVHPAVHEAVGARLAHDQAQTGCGPQAFVGLHRTHARNTGDRVQFGLVAQAGEQLEQLERVVRQLLQPAYHQVDHVVGKFALADGLRVETPAPAGLAETQQPVLDQPREKLQGEIGVAACFGVHQRGQGLALAGRAVERCGHQLRRLPHFERAQRHHAHPGAALAHRLAPLHQGVGGPHVGGTVGAHHQHAAHILLGHQVGQQLEAGRVDPLDVVQAQHQHRSAGRQRADELAEHGLQPHLRFQRRQLGRRRLVADDERQLGNEVQHQASVRPQRFGQRAPPWGQHRLTLCRQAAHQGTHCLRQREVGDVVVVLVEPGRHHQRAGQRLGGA